MADQNEETSLSDDLAAAMDEAEINEEVEAEIKAEETPEVEAQTDIPAETGSEPEYEPEKSDEPLAAEAEVPRETAANDAPLDWSPELKEQWAGIPAEVQQQISSRESAINQTLQETAQIRGEYDQFQNMIAPYIPMMAAEGVNNPAQAIKGLMETTAALQMGNPQQRAQKMAQLIGHYQIDIGMLDSLLAGEPAQDPQTTQLEQMLDQRMAPVNQLMNQFNQAQQANQQQVSDNANTEIQTFAQANPHFDNVRLVMADFLDMAKNNGQNMTLQEAYDRACASNPQIAAQVAQSRATQAAQASQAGINAKQQAASSVTGSRASGSDAGGMDGMSLRDTIAAQFEDGGRI